MKSFIFRSLVPFVTAAAVAAVVTYGVILAVHRFVPNATTASFTHILLVFPQDGTGTLTTPSNDILMTFVPANDPSTQGACGCPYCCSQ